MRLITFKIKISRSSAWYYSSVERTRINVKSLTLGRYNFQNNHFRKFFFAPSFLTRQNNPFQKKKISKKKGAR